MNDSYMGLIDERFMDFIDEDLKTAKDIKQEEIEKDADIQEKSKEEISENEQYQTQENTVKENTSLKDNNDQEKQYVKGNLTADVEIKDLRSNEGQDFRVASFSIAQNDGMGNVKFMN